MKRLYENKRININLSLLNDTIILLPDIYSIIVAYRMEEKLIFIK